MAYEKVAVIPNLSAVIIRGSNTREPWALYISDSIQVIDWDYSIQYLRWVAWSCGVSDENITISGEYD